MLARGVLRQRKILRANDVRPLQLPMRCYKRRSFRRAFFLSYAFFPTLCTQSISRLETVTVTSENAMRRAGM